MCKYCKFEEYGNWINKELCEQYGKHRIITKNTDYPFKTTTECEIAVYYGARIFINDPDDIELAAFTTIFPYDGIGDKQFSWQRGIQINYCPVCGRKLRGVQNDR